jgi:hypothetical protein
MYAMSETLTALPNLQIAAIVAMIMGIAAKVRVRQADAIVESDSCGRRRLTLAPDCDWVARKPDMEMWRFSHSCSIKRR